MGTTISMVLSAFQDMGHTPLTLLTSINCPICQVGTTRSVGVGTAKGRSKFGQIAPTLLLREVVQVLQVLQALRQLQRQIQSRCQCQPLPHLLLTNATLMNLSVQNAVIMARNSRIAKRRVVAGS